MKNVQDKYTVFDLVLTPKSPVFIGSGESLDKAMCYTDGKLVKFVDEKKFIDFLVKTNRLNKLNPSQEDFSKLFEICHKEKRDIWKDYTVNVLGGSIKQLNKVSTFIKGPNGLPYIPGSSVKGALKTAMLSYEIYRNKQEYAGLFDKIDTLTGKKLAEKLGDIENKFLNKYVLKYGSSYKDNVKTSTIIFKKSTIKFFRKSFDPVKTILIFVPFK